ncbi:unnamed protein product [Protopolystoma xenopodis]|uniref:Uncharacterized protein n=1 Tax=Protopolystoma xenopodis TaxID=117903 RepID=A0A3S4ZTD3_9PLAT|nr:unnamed protein product [Protopolystoma xenopodis]
MRRWFVLLTSASCRSRADTDSVSSTTLPVWLRPVSTLSVA